MSAENVRGAPEWQRGEAERLYEARATHLWSFGRRLGLSPGEADDAVHEAYTRLVGTIGRNWPMRPEAWLFTVVHNLAADIQRRARFTSMRADVVDLAVDDGPGTHERLERLTVWAAVDRLPVRQRAAIYLRYRADLEFSVIADVLGISESGARGDCFRGLASLRKKVLRDD